MPRGGAQAVPLPGVNRTALCPRFETVPERNHSAPDADGFPFSLERRSKDQRDAGPMPQDGAQAAPLPGVNRTALCPRFETVPERNRSAPSADGFPFSLERRSKDQRDAGPMPQGGAQAAPLPGVNRTALCPRFETVPERNHSAPDADGFPFSLERRSKDQRDAGPMPRGGGPGRPFVRRKPLARTCSLLSIRRERTGLAKSSSWQGSTPGWSRPVPGYRREARRRRRPWLQRRRAGRRSL